MTTEALYGGRLQDIDGKRWVGNESNGHLVNKQGKWVDAIPTDSKPTKIEILDEESRPFIGMSHPV